MKRKVHTPLYGEHGWNYRVSLSSSEAWLYQHPAGDLGLASLCFSIFPLPNADEDALCLSYASLLSIKRPKTGEVPSIW